MVIKSKLDFVVVDLGDELLGALLVNCASEGKAGSEDGLDCAGETLRHGLLLNDFGDFLDLLESEVAFMVDVFDFLSVSFIAAELFNE